MSDASNDTDVITLTKQLVERPSITPEDAGCQQLMAEHLTALGFNIESLFYVDTLNMWARRGTELPLFCFAGHTDVVPTGPQHKWDIPPFEPTSIDGYLYGRGTADMKGSLAAMVVATQRFVKKHPNHKGSIAFLITSDEEGPFVNGTTRVIDTLEARNEKITWCLVGEPSSTDKIGDVVKVGRRGSLTGALTVNGIQGHVAYPQFASNPIHLVAPALQQLVSAQWDNGNAFFPATTLQVSNINGGTGAPNVIPGELSIDFNFRYSSEVNAQMLTSKVETILDQHHLPYELHWTYNGLPFLTEPGELVDAVTQAVETVTGYQPKLLTTGGTSDGRFIAPTGAKVIELGPCNATIHKLNECVSEADLIQLTQMYELILEKMLT
ncbi:MAG: succinyl-diaminopimelate desuccinylase [Alteromonadaceae bacterium]|jgi:succinyl-diaminopimelate desuccinylase